MKTRTPDSQVRLDPSVLCDLTWWSWIAMIALLIVRFTIGGTAPMAIAAAICTALAAYDLILRRGDFRAMSVQIRLSYSLLLLIGLLPWMRWIHVMQLAGTSARVLLGYCLLQRELLLCSWNRPARLSFAAVREVIFAPPGPGGLLRFRTDVAESPCGFVAPASRAWTNSPSAL